MQVTISVDGTISTHLFFSGWFEGQLIDTNNVFGGGSLTGDAFNVTWTYNDTVMQSGVLTINGHSLTYGPGISNYLFTDADRFYVGTTVAPGFAMNTFIESTANDLPSWVHPFSYTFNPAINNLAYPFGISGSFSYNRLDGYFDIQTVALTTDAPVPGPILGVGLPGLLIIGAFLLRAFHQRSKNQ